MSWLGPMTMSPVTSVTPLNRSSSDWDKTLSSFTTNVGNGSSDRHIHHIAQIAPLPEEHVSDVEPPTSYADGAAEHFPRDVL